MPWARRILRGTEVFARVRDDGSLDAGSDGRVDVKYKLDEGAKIYRAAARNLEPSAGGDAAVVPDPTPAAPVAPAAGSVIVYTDGACSGNPGPMGIGVVILDGGDRKELSEYLGEGTNNIAELTAIERALDLLGAARDRPVLVHSDSSYSIGLLSQNWKPKANKELVARLRQKVAQFSRLRFVKVDGHAGVPENERCDVLARAAVDSARSSRSSRQ